MPSGEKQEAILKSISDILTSAGYSVERNKPVGKGKAAQYIDLFALGPKDAIVVEVKESKTSTTDLARLERLVKLKLSSDPQLKGKEILKVIISPGTMGPAMGLSKKWGIDIVESDKPDEITLKFKTLLEAKGG